VLQVIRLEGDDEHTFLELKMSLVIFNDFSGGHAPGL